MGRPGWAVAERLAIFEPELGASRGVVRPVRLANRTFARYHLATVDPAGVARYVQTASSASEARRVAEAQVRGKA